MIPMEAAMGSVVWNRRQVLKGGLSLVACGTLAGCSALPLARQSPVPRAGKLPRVGYLVNTIHYAQSEVLIGLSNLGYVDTQNITIEYRYSRHEDRPDELAMLAAELVDLPVDVILVADTLSTRAAQQA